MTKVLNLQTIYQIKKFGLIVNLLRYIKLETQALLIEFLLSFNF